MKTIYITSLFALLLISISSCSKDWLNLTPSDGSSREEAASTYAGATTLLVGVYDALQGDAENPNNVPNGANYTYYGARFICYGDVRGDDMQSVNSGKRTTSLYMMNYTINDAPNIWDIPYKVIRRANTLIQIIDEGVITDGTKENLDNLKGQALAIRALAHFDLLRVYSLPYEVDKNGNNLGVPIVLKQVDASYTPTRNTISEVYTQVEKDLIEAIKLMKVSNGTGYFNQWAAKALLARVYLYKGTDADNQKALDLATEVVEKSPYTLWANNEYVNSWSKAGTSEVLFEIVNFSKSDWNDREAIGYLYSEDGYDDAVMTKSYVDFIEANYAGDVRLGMMKMTVSESHPWKGRKAYINKYPGREGTNDVRVNNVPILRLSEMYLIAAEAAFKLGNKTDAAKYLNTIILRGDPNNQAISASTVSLNRILQENRIEFVGEGHRYFDLIRNNQTVLRYKDAANKGWHLLLQANSQEFDKTYFRAILPIPQEEINANTNIRSQQNPGY